MKRLLHISLLAIALLSLATPVYAQEGYPVDKGYPVDEPTEEAIEKQSQGAAEAVADQSVDFPAGGEGPEPFKINGYDWRIFGFYYAMIALTMRQLSDDYEKNRGKIINWMLLSYWVIRIILFFVLGY